MDRPLVEAGAGLSFDPEDFFKQAVRFLAVKNVYRLFRYCQFEEGED